MNMMTRTLMVAVAASLGTVAARADETIVPSPGDYKFLSLVLEDGGKTITPTWGVGASAHEGNIYVRSAFRDGKARFPGRLSVRQIVSELTVTDSSIKGEYLYLGQRSTYEARYTINATIDGGKISGTWEDAQKKTGKVSGTIVTEAQLQKDNAFTAGKDWPDWSGPTTSMAAAACGLSLVEDFNKDARLVWKSEELIPQGNGNALNYHPLALTDRTMGGGASAVVADGKVFVFYYQPAGTEYMKIVGKEYLQGLPGDKYIEQECKKVGVEPSPFMSEKFLVKADDVVVCMEAATGKTLWKNVFAGNSMNQPSHKGGVVNNTPCVGEGKVFARGPGGTLYAIEMATGKPLWQVPKMSAEGVVPWSGARNQCTAPIFAGGTLIVPDNGNTLYGINPADGKQLWKLPGKSYHFQVPARWVHQGQEYVVSMTEPPISKQKGAPAVATAVCLEPKSGKVLWEVTLSGNANKGVSVFGDAMYVTAGGAAAPDKPSPAGTITAYKLTLENAQPLWQSPATHCAGDAPPATNGRYVVVGGPSESHLYDAATGKDLATYKGNGPFNEGYAAFFEDKVILSLDGSHGHCDMMILGATPETFSQAPCHWVQPHPNTTSYHNKFMTFPMVEGRIIMRGYDGVYCYDVRKK